MSSHAALKRWITSFAEDVALVQRFVAHDKAPLEARRISAGALSYLVTRMDLIPDWEETAGIVDDAMILRVAASLASDKDLGSVGADVLAGMGRLANEADDVEALLGADLYPRLKKFAQDLGTKAVRGRTPEAIVTDAKVRGQLWQEISDELASLPAAPISDPEAVVRTVKNYLGNKLA